MPRLFTALEIPREAGMMLSFLRGGLGAARWIDPENYHLTLRFVGDVDARTADELVAALDRVARAPVRVELKGLGAFGSRKPHSVYASAVLSPELTELHGDIDRACRRVGIAPDPRRFTPHVTLARLRNPKDEDVARYLAARGDFRQPPFAAARFCLFSSRDSVGGGPYLMEEAFSLNAPAPASSRNAPAASAMERL